MNKEILQPQVEQNTISHCKNCGANLFEAGSTTQKKSVDSNSVDVIHVVCNRCGYIQTVKQTV